MNQNDLFDANVWKLRSGCCPGALVTAAGVVGMLISNAAAVLVRGMLTLKYVWVVFRDNDEQRWRCLDHTQRTLADLESSSQSQHSTRAAVSVSFSPPTLAA